MKIQEQILIFVEKILARRFEGDEVSLVAKTHGISKKSYQLSCHLKGRDARTQAVIIRYFQIMRRHIDACMSGGPWELQLMSIRQITEYDDSKGETEFKARLDLPLGVAEYLLKNLTTVVIKHGEVKKMTHRFI